VDEDLPTAFLLNGEGLHQTEHDQLLFFKMKARGKLKTKSAVDEKTASRKGVGAPERTICLTKDVIKGSFTLTSKGGERRSGAPSLEHHERKESLNSQEEHEKLVSSGIKKKKKKKKQWVYIEKRRGIDKSQGGSIDRRGRKSSRKRLNETKWTSGQGCAP